MIDLSGRTALVTGGARGLGRAIADMLAGAGASVAIVDLADSLDAGAVPGNWQHLALDLTAAEAETNLTDFVATLPRLDILIANAGLVPPWQRIASLDLDEWDRAFALNVRGVALSLKAAAPKLAQSPCGAAVLMASINGYRAHPDQALYTSTKHAVLGLMRAAALDMGRDGTRVNALAPGPILTDALQSRIEARAQAGGTPADTAIAALNAETALGRIATEKDVARAACFLASDLASGITGVCLPVEAGLP
ncbi:SDR family NAD(P)-dependent oxidoreductase [Marivita sp.]|uniref:SDR family NAD(P)-dependent oxidoreductase n=1 Tax=Marivita sp. TaxID=2003365 RepID=UPI003F6F86FC